MLPGLRVARTSVEMNGRQRTAEAGKGWENGCATATHYATICAPTGMKQTSPPMTHTLHEIIRTKVVQGLLVRSCVESVDGTGS